jgi:uncharacterized protein (DUF58 family)
MSRWIERFFKSDRTYIVPNGTGIAFGALFFSLLFVGAAWNRPLLQLIGFMIAIPYLSAMVQSNNNIKDLKIRVVESPLAPAGTAVEARVILEQSGRDSSRNVWIGVRGRPGAGRTVAKRIAPGDPLEVMIPLGSYPRGTHPFPDLVVFSAHPIGMFHTWKRFRPENSVWIHPTPAGSLTWRQRQFNADDSHLDYRDHREMNPGDPENRVDWKRFARDKQRLLRVYDVDPGRKVVLHWEDVRHLPTEEALSQMTRWLLDAERRGIEATVEAPFTRGPVTLSSMKAHLKALAGYGESR